MASENKRVRPATMSGDIYDSWLIRPLREQSMIDVLTGKLEFGTEIVHSADSSIVALLGASPGASTAVWIMVHMLENCFHEQLTGHWVPKLKEAEPTSTVYLQRLPDGGCW